MKYRTPKLGTSVEPIMIIVMISKNVKFVSLMNTDKTDKPTKIMWKSKPTKIEVTIEMNHQ